MRKLIVATRRSALALAQARAFVRSLGLPEGAVEELHVVTSGDRIQDRPLYEAGGKGLFVKEIEEALLDRRADFAVHSMKDLPAKLPPSLVIACTPKRADPRDVLLVRPGREPSLAALPNRARVGSSSLRRRVALLRARPDLAIEPLRGNVDSRIKRLVAGDFDAIVLAAAGLARLGLDPSIVPPHAPIAIEQMLPAVAQGILAIEAREGDSEVHAALAVVADHDALLTSTAERGVLRALGADCTVPLAALATLSEGIIHLRAWLSEPDGSRFRTLDASLPSHEVGEVERWSLELGAQLLASAPEPA